MQGQEYVVYLPDGGSVTVNLSDASGTLDVEWYNPKYGTYYDERPVTGGGCGRFTPPFTGDAVLHISTDTFPPRTTSVVIPTQNKAGWNNVTPVVVTFFFALTTVLVLVILVILKYRKRGPWTTVRTRATAGSDAGNVTDIHEANFKVTVLKEGTTEIWYYSSRQYLNSGCYGVLLSLNYPRSSPVHTHILAPVAFFLFCHVAYIWTMSI